jgi:hypothetical protein
LRLEEKIPKVNLGATTIAITLILMAPVTLTTGVFAQTTPSNDDFDSAAEISSLPFTDSISTVEATTASDDPSCVSSVHTVWYSFTPEEDVTVQANTFGSNYDTTLSVYQGTRGELDQIVCNDDTSNSLLSEITFEATAGQTYYFMVGSCCGGPGGNLVFNVDIGGAPPPPPLEIQLAINPTGTVNPRTGEVTVSGTVECSQDSEFQISGEVGQRAGRAIIRGFFSESITCTGGEEPIEWTATLQGENGRFVAGRAAVAATADCDCNVDSVSTTVQLRGSR